MNSLKQAKLRKQKLSKKPKIKVIKQFQQIDQYQCRSSTPSSQNNRLVYKYFKQNNQQFSFQCFNLCYFDNSFERDAIKNRQCSNKYFSQSSIKNKIFTKLLSEQPKQKAKNKQIRTLIRFKNIQQIKVCKINSRRKKMQFKKQSNNIQNFNSPKSNYEQQKNLIFSKYNFFKSPKCVQLDQNLQNVRLKSKSLIIDLKPQNIQRNSVLRTTKMKRWKTQQNQPKIANQNQINGWQIKHNEYDLLL